MIKRIEICGGIAAGKTSLARQFEKSGMSVLYEAFENNPFLQDFYSDSLKYAFETEITFALQRFHGLKTVSGKGLIVTDCSLQQDYAYAKNNLGPEEFIAFEGVYREIIRQIGEAALVVYIKCSPSVLLKRIQDRNRGMELTIRYDYINDSVGVLEKHLEDRHIHYITVDSEDLDFRKDIVFDKIKDIILKKVDVNGNIS